MKCLICQYEEYIKIFHSFLSSSFRLLSLTRKTLFFPFFLFLPSIDRDENTFPSFSSVRRD